MATTALNLEVEIENPGSITFQGWVRVTIPESRRSALFGGADWAVFLHGPPGQPTPPPVASVGLLGAKHTADADQTEIWLYGDFPPGMTVTELWGAFLEVDSEYTDIAFVVHPHLPQTSQELLSLFPAAYNLGVHSVIASTATGRPAENSKAAIVYDLTGHRHDNGWHIDMRLTFTLNSQFVMFEGIAWWSSYIHGTLSAPAEDIVISFPAFAINDAGHVHFDQNDVLPAAVWSEVERVHDGGGFPFSGYLEFTAGGFGDAEGLRKTLTGKLRIKTTNEVAWNGFAAPGVNVPLVDTYLENISSSVDLYVPRPALPYSDEHPYGQFRYSPGPAGRPVLEFPFGEMSDLANKTGMMHNLRQAAQTECYRTWFRTEPDGSMMLAANHPNLQTYNSASFQWGADALGKRNDDGTPLFGSETVFGTPNVPWSSHDWAHLAMRHVVWEFIYKRSFIAERTLRHGIELYLKSINHFQSVRGTGRWLLFMATMADLFPDKAAEILTKVQAWVTALDTWLHDWASRQVLSGGDMKPYKTSTAYNNSLPNNPNTNAHAPWQGAEFLTGLWAVRKVWGTGTVGSVQFWQRAFQIGRVVLLEGVALDPVQAIMGQTYYLPVYACSYDPAGDQVLSSYADVNAAVEAGAVALAGSSDIFREQLPGLLLTRELHLQTGFGILTGPELTRLDSVLEQELSNTTDKASRFIRSLQVPPLP